MMMEALTVEELALQRIFDLKNEVALEFESHQRLFNEALLFNVFLKGFDPPPWLSVSGKRGEIPILPSRRGSYSVFRVGSGGTRVHLQDSVKSFREQDRFSELYGGFLCKRKRVSSSVDRPSCPEVVAAKKPRVEESDFVVAREIDGDQGKGLDKDVQEEVKGKEHGFGDGQHGENEDRRHLFDERHGGNEGGQGLFDAQLGRNEENIESQVENGECVEKGARVRPSRRGAKAKEKKNDAVSPFVGRITRARAKNCQVLLSAKEDICKKRTAARSRQPRGRKKNASATGASGLEVSEEPVMELLSSAAAVKAEIGGKASPLMTAFEIEDQLSASPKMTKSQTRNESSPVVAESQVEVKLSSAMKRMQNEDHSSPSVNHSQIEDHAQRDDFGCTEGTTKKSKVTYASFEPGSRGSEDIDHKNAQVEKDTSENVKRCVEGETVPMDDFRRIVDSCDAEQLVTSNLTDTSHKQEMPNVMENVQQHEISDLTENTQLKLREEEHPVDFQNQPKDNFYLVEENAERKVPSVLTPLENRKSMDAIPIHTTLVSNATCTPQEMVASRFKEIFSGKVDLLDDSVKSTPTLVQEILSNPRYCGKSGFSDAPHPSKRSNVFERSIFSDQGCHPIYVIASGVVQDAPDSPSIEGTGHKLSLKADASDMTVMDVPLRCETEDANAVGIGLGEISVCPNEKIPDQVEPNTTLCEERDEFEKANPSNLGFIHHKTASFDSALGLSCHILHKSESDVTGDLTIKFRSRSVDCCKRILGEETNNGSNVVASTGGHECLKAVSFRMFRGLSGSSVKLLSQGNEDQNLKGGRSASPVDVSAKISPEVKENSESQMPEDSKLMSMTEKVDEPIFYRQKPWASQGKLGAYDSALAISSPDEAAEGQIETSCNAPSKKLVVADMELMDRTLLSSGNLFSRNMAEVKEEGGMELQHNSWPKYQKRSGLVQQQFHSAGQPRLCQTESCSKILDYNPSIRLSNGGIEVTSNKDACLVSHNDEVAKPSTCDSEGNCDMEYSEERPDNITNILLLKDFACVGSNSTEAFPDRQSPSLISSQTKKDVKQSLRYGEHRQRAKLILEECSTRMGHYPRMSFTDLAVEKCGIGIENVKRSSPPCISYSTTNEGSFGCTGLSQVRVDSMCFQATSNNASAACLQGQAHLHAASLQSHPFQFNFEVTSPQNHCTEGEHRLLLAGLMTPAPNTISKCRTLTPLDASWSHASGLHEQKECSGEFWGKIYAMNDAYMTAHVLPSDKFQTSSGFNGVVEYGTKSKNSPSLIPAVRTFCGRIGKNSMDKDSNFFPKQVQMIKEHVGCFRIEEESGVEEESMDHSISVKQVENLFGSSTKKSVSVAKKVLMNSSSAKQNSPVTTPAGVRFFERISTNSMDAGSAMLSKKASMNQNYAYSFNNEEDIRLEKENRDPSVPMNEFQKRYGSSVKKKVLRNYNTRGYCSNANQVSPTKSNQKSSNFMSNVRSLIPLVQQKPTAISMITGKRDIKVKALEVAEAVKRLEEKKEQERKKRKELVKHGEQEKHFQEKPKEERSRGERGEETIGATSDSSNKSISNGALRKKPVGCSLPKSHAQNSFQLDTSVNGVDLKLRRALEVKAKLEQEKVRKLEEEQRRKEEDRKKKGAELAAKKRKREGTERKDREEKQKRLEEVHRQQKEIEEQLRAEKEVKELRRRALDEHERKRKAMEEEAKKQRRIEKEKEAAERRRRLVEDTKASKFDLKDVKHLEETFQRHETTLQTHKANAGKGSSMCNNFAKCRQPETEGQSMPDMNLKLLGSTEPDTNILSYEISPYKGSDEEDDNEDAVLRKFIPLWARKENLIQHLNSQQYTDPDEIFTGAKTCSLNEVFGTYGSLRRKDFHRRSKSGEWLADKFTWKEEYQYKLQMGYINKG